MFTLGGKNIRVYLCIGSTDMRKGIMGLSSIAKTIVPGNAIKDGILFVFRGRRSDRLKILYWDGQGYCLYYKILEQGKFQWMNSAGESASITVAQLSMLIEGIDWRLPRWSVAPEYVG